MINMVNIAGAIPAMHHATFGSLPFQIQLEMIMFWVGMFASPAIFLFLVIRFFIKQGKKDTAKRYERAYQARLSRHQDKQDRKQNRKQDRHQDRPSDWNQNSLNNLWQENNQRHIDRVTEQWAERVVNPDPREEQRRQQEENAANGRISWRPIGKQYTANPNALSRIWGMEEVVGEIEKSITNLMMHPKLVAEYDASMNAGLLLYGPPGTGKTELARAIAEHLGLYFMAIKPSDLMATLVGGTEQNITAMFDEARRHAPSILFIDEIDSVGSQRGSSHMYHDTALTQLLTEMDGFNKREGVFVLAATNRLDVLDDALLRDGRFGTQIEVPAPDMQALWNMFSYWASPLHLAPDVYAVNIGLALQGQTGATVKGLVERLKHIEIDKRVHGQPAIITKEEVDTEIEKILQKKHR